MKTAKKYMKLPPLELTMPDGKPSDILSWWKLRDHSLPADPEKGRPEGLPRLARMARQYHNEPRRPPSVPSGSSQRQAAPTTT
mmetsp:Transcript_10818/g.21965  ORF Transcript_10818/g.21965 Transcript_10818/m.21965 type:complete len:83 (+) Transcript_10818:1-249(+)